MKVFVTGATGFIGKRLVDKLIKNGDEVIALVRNQKHNLPNEVKVIYGDIIEMDSFKYAGAGCSRLYHLAAMITFDPKRRDELLRINGQGTLNILSAAKYWDIDRTVIISSACTMGLSYKKEQILNETNQPNSELIANNPYMESKLLAERYAIESTKNQTVVVVNPTTVYGPGDWTLNSGTLILKISKSKVIPVPSGGSNVIDVDDVVEGIIAAGERGKSGSRYILGGENLSFKEIFSEIADVVDCNPLFVRLPHFMRIPMSVSVGVLGKITQNRFLTSQIIGDMFAYKFYSNKLAKEKLGWVPRYTFKESIERAIEFYRREGLL